MRHHVILTTLVLVGSSFAVWPSSAGQPDQRRESAQAPAAQRAYLPALLRKTLLTSERECIRSLEDIVKHFVSLEQGGVVTSRQVNQIEHELLQGRIKVVQRESDYRDAVDQFKLRFDLSPEQVQKMEESAILPLTRHLQRIEDIHYKDYEAVDADLRKGVDPEQASKLRALLRQSFTDSALVKETRFSKHCPTQWQEWAKLKDLNDALRKYEAEHIQLLDRRAAFEAKKQPYPQADVQRLEEVVFQIDLGRLESLLRTYERQPWKADKDDNRRQSQHADIANNLIGQALTLLETAVSDQIALSRRSWPELAPVRIEDADILTCDLEKAQQIVASLFKKPDAAVAGKIRMRKVRALAETYRIQQRLCELSLLQLRNAMGILAYPSAPGQFVRATDATALIQEVINTQRSLFGVKSQLFSSWIEYQIARLDLYSDLGLTPP